MPTPDYETLKRLEPANQYVHLSKSQRIQGLKTTIIQAKANKKLRGFRAHVSSNALSLKDHEKHHPLPQG